MIAGGGMIQTPGEPLRVVHALPGRLRLRWPQLHSEPERAGEIADRLVREHGVLDVTVNPGTGSLLVVYDPAAQDARSVARIALEATGARRVLAPDEESPRPAAPAPGGPSRLAVATAAFFEELNADVRRATEGGTDLATLLPLAFVGFGLLEVAVTGDVPAPPWWSLFWWSFRSFLSLNDPAIRIAAEKRAAHVHPAAEGAF
jgi:hypothetical protein